MFSFYLEEIFFAKTTKMKDTKGIKDLKGEDENNKEKFDADHEDGDDESRIFASKK